MSEGESRLWKWTELPSYSNSCKTLSATLGLSYEHEFDLVRWAIEENVCRNPLAAPLDPRFTNDDRRRAFRTTYAPALTALPPLVVFFRVGRYPEFGAQGVIEGREVWLEADLRAIGYAELAGDS